MKKNEKLSVSKKILAGALIFTFTLATGQKVFAVSYNPNEDYKNLGIRFWEDQKPGVDFYINSSNRYLIETVPKPYFGSTTGDWSVFSLTRGMYLEADYLNQLPNNYFSNYLTRIDNKVNDQNGVLDRTKLTEWDRLILSLTPLNHDVTRISNEYDFIKKISESYNMVKKQGINSASWTLVALNSGDYKFYTNTANLNNANTEGKLIDFVLDSQFTNGGWALNKNELADPDVTSMVLLGLAPYYRSEERFKQIQAESKYSYSELKTSVEKGVEVLSDLQKDHGGFSSYSNDNAESTAQVIVALTELGIDPKSEKFLTNGAIRDGIKTNNMIDSLLTFWAQGSGKAQGVGGFKHVTSGSDGGSDSGTTVNGMATDQATYAMIAYHRFITNQSTLFNLMDQKNTPYTSFRAKPVTLSYNISGNQTNEKSSYLAMTNLKKPTSEIKGKTFENWNTQPDGKGTSYQSNDILSMPNKNVTLYGQFKNNIYHLTLNSNDGHISNIKIPETFTVDDQFNLPTSENIKKDGYLFQGWYLNKDFKGNSIKTINKGTTESLTLYAKWEKIDTSVIAVINNIDNIGEVTLEKSGLIENIRASVSKLTPEQQQKITNLPTLVAAETKIKELTELASEEERANARIKEVKDAINTIGEVSLSKKEQIQKSRSLYDNLGEYKDRFNQSSINDLNILIEAEAQLSKLEIQEVIETINRIEEPVTLNSKLAIETGRHMYNNLSTDQQRQVTNIEKLIALEKQYKNIEEQVAVEEKIQALVNATEQAIRNIGEVSLQSETTIQLARKQYDSLDETIKNRVTNYNDLEVAETRLIELKVEKENKDKESIEQVIQAIKNIGEVAIDKQEKIEFASNLYNQLSTELKPRVPQEQVKILIEAKSTIQKLIDRDKKVKKLEQDILSTKIESITIESKNKIESFTSQVKLLEEHVSQEAKDHLKKLENKLDQKIAEDNKNKETEKQLANQLADKISKLVLGNETKNQPVVKGANHVAETKRVAKEYEELSNYGKTQISSKIKDQLSQAMDRVNVIEKMIADIAKLPEVDALTIKDEGYLSSLSNQFEELSAIEQNEVTNADKLAASNNKMKELKKGASKSTGRGRGKSTNSNRRGSGFDRNNPNKRSKNRVFPKTGEEVGNQLTSLGIALLGGVYFWKKKEEKDSSL
ncbi:InlB B-repeat-containing protein [Vagococcus sp.]|uniref:InlB B-repeat-containing protein n=1 Tax=Vagococcus sp. TaxID=1933889 RepID=UPI002FC5DB4D